MFYAIHDDAGRITQGSKVFAPDEGYEKQLRDLGHSFATDPQAMLLSPDDWYVSAGLLRKRPSLSVLAVRTRIKAGGAETGLLVGVPQAARVTITTGGVIQYQGIPGATELAIPIPVPCVYRVAIELWPYKTYVAEIEAVE
ncbi:hypothetical protein [Rhodopseudomonas telluris]|uniref:Uncharacterized protein n=1 Tax=Rhodopseudomonas telluris TaxID=644215 RepID=A0ABV6EZM1_9BRAD